MLADPKFVEGVSEVITIAADKYSSSSPATRWEMIKLEITGFSTMYARRAANIKKQRILRLRENIEYLERLLQEKFESKVEEELTIVKGKLNLIMTEKVQTLMFLSKAKWTTEGEKNSKYFFSLAKSRYNAKTMFQLRQDDGRIITDGPGILREQHRFYDNLYHANKEVNFGLVNNTSSKLSDENRLQLEKDISLGELEDAVKHFPASKCPGCDGLPAELYQKLLPQIGTYLLDAYHYAIQQGLLHITACRGLLSLIPKKEKDLLYVKNWRPLTMLSLDYKILSKILDNRLKGVLDGIIELYQTGFMSGRFILTNVLKLMEIMDSATRKQVEQVIISIDFEKCFDTVDHTAIQGGLKYFGFGEKYIQMTMILFKSFEVCAQNNGYVMDWITPTRGLHQGCCISPHLYNICGQIFAHLFENNVEVKGLVAHNVKMLISQFADNTNVFLEATSTTICAVSDTLAHAECNLGLKVNYNKTSIYQIGSLIGTNAKLYTKCICVEGSSN